LEIKYHYYFESGQVAHSVNKNGCSSVLHLEEEKKGNMNREEINQEGAKVIPKYDVFSTSLKTVGKI